jgi:hypothetical protein
MPHKAEGQGAGPPHLQEFRCSNRLGPTMISARIASPGVEAKVELLDLARLA